MPTTGEKFNSISGLSTELGANQWLASRVCSKLGRGHRFQAQGLVDESYLLPLLACIVVAAVVTVAWLWRAIRMTGSDQTKRLVYVLPRLNLASTVARDTEIRIGEAIFVPDDDAIWSSVVGKPRPKWLDIFCDFGPLTRDEPPSPVRGMLLVANDDEWLEKHAITALSVLFTVAQHTAQWRTPAEAFHSYPFRASDAPAELVSMLTKHGTLIEDERSLRLSPPVTLRGHHNRQVTIDLTENFNSRLIDRFRVNPNDRMAVACRHLFRTQFSDLFLAPIEQDLSAFCACLEATLGIESTQRDIGKELGRRVTNIYGDLPGLSAWIEGLYLFRCNFVHGDVQNADDEGNPTKQQAYNDFVNSTGKWTILRNLCYDVIRHGVEHADGGSPPLRLMNRERELIQCYFLSDDLWRQLRRYFKQQNAAELIVGLDGEEATEFFRSCGAFLQAHKWECMKNVPTLSQIKNFLRSVAVTLMNCEDADQEDKDAALEVSRLAGEEQDKDVRTWIAHHEYWRDYPPADHLASLLKAILLHGARFYDRD